MKNRTPNLTKVAFPKAHVKKRLKRLRSSKGTSLVKYKSAFYLKDKRLLNFTHYEACRRVIVRSLRKGKKINLKDRRHIRNLDRMKKKVPSRGKKFSFLLRSHFYLGLTKKPNQVRMGKGKGSLDRWVQPCYPGRILLEFPHLMLRPKKMARILYKLSRKLPGRVSILGLRESQRRETFRSRIVFIKSLTFRRPSMEEFCQRKIVMEGKKSACIPRVKLKLIKPCTPVV